MIQVGANSNELEFKLSLEDAEFFRQHFQELIEKYRMTENGSAYSVILSPVDNWESDSVTQDLAPTIRYLTDEVIAFM